MFIRSSFSKTKFSTVFVKLFRLSRWLASKTSVSCSVVFGSVFGYFRQATGRWGESNLLMVCQGFLD